MMWPHPHIKQMYTDSFMNNVIDITPENFQQVILQDSQTQVVMVEFWAEGYEPSQQLAPVLRRVFLMIFDSGLLPDTWKKIFDRPSSKNYKCKRTK